MKNILFAIFYAHVVVALLLVANFAYNKISPTYLSLKQVDYVVDPDLIKMNDIWAIDLDVSDSITYGHIHTTEPQWHKDAHRKKRGILPSCWAVENPQPRENCSP